MKPALPTMWAGRAPTGVTKDRFDELQADFVSDQAIRTYPTKRRGTTYSREATDPATIAVYSIH
jgi:hypothetical protein